ncbi:MAG: DNA recombination protein RmuC [Verrucomicrobia bacterium CG_4_9_14_3_um_filter_43_20]|nr:MAG: hypothetical protein AUJ82_07740 [Verrucomicrobia bacterium CG1_02_43_26]PIP59991.1 MAG: DNA recombination protein RmuC [Verrucomicrobia bacterium CG22_combo_CG10-13_8_21_14_all_43_17]PJA44819.1 MAG: DNA recombination protein RmuC [Verrucomicrobia bacterium CG_4_9_14_3_um_filter_43_20]
MELSYIITALAAFTIGGTGTFIYLRAQAKSTVREINLLQEQLSEASRKNVSLEAEKYALTKDFSAISARREAEQIAADEKIALLEAAKTNLTDAFKALSADALKTNNQAFLDLAKQSLTTFQKDAQGDLDKRNEAISHLVTPMQKTLEQFQEHTRAIEKNRITAFSTLEEQLKNISSSHLKLETETRNLTKALRTPHVRGQWGELQLKRSVEIAGMLEYVDFQQQATQSNNERIQRPDMIIRLPNNRQIAIDAKAPLMAYLEAVEHPEPEQQKIFLKKHAQQVRDHIQLLASKQYWKQFETSPEFVILFLPGESFFSAALQADAQLLEQSFKDRVILATPTTLIALLKTVAAGWQENNIALEAQKISQLGQVLYERITVLARHFEDLRKHLEKSVDAYNKTVSSLESRVLPSARKFKEMHIKSEQEIPIAQPIDKLPTALTSEVQTS